MVPSLSTPSLGITGSQVTLSHDSLKSAILLSTPSLGITERRASQPRYNRRRLSTPSLGITKLTVAELLAAKRKSFNSLSRDHTNKLNEFINTLEAFNSLSRDHLIWRRELPRRARERFQLPLSGSRVALTQLYQPPRQHSLSTPSLGITTNVDDGPALNAPSFNSLSRDHLYKQLLK